VVTAIFGRVASVSAERIEYYLLAHRWGRLARADSGAYDLEKANDGGNYDRHFDQKVESHE
jgi:hypothetical protein